MTFVGIDGGLANTGYCVLDLYGSVQAIGVIRTASQRKRRKLHHADDLVRRLGVIEEALQKVFEVHAPAVAAIEQFTHLRHAGAAAKYMAAWATCRRMLVEWCPVLIPHPDEVKAAMGLKRTASKAEMIGAVRAAQPLVEWPVPKGAWEHRADAYAVARFVMQSDMGRMLVKSGGHDAKV